MWPHVLEALGSLGSYGYHQVRPSISETLALNKYLDSLQVLMSARGSLQPRERLELNRRSLHFLLYLVRSPFYQRVTEGPLLRLLRAAGDTLPLVGLLTRK